MKHIKNRKEFCDGIKTVNLIAKYFKSHSLRCSPKKNGKIFKMVEKNGKHTLYMNGEFVEEREISDSSIWWLAWRIFNLAY